MTKDEFSALITQYDRLVYTVCLQLARDPDAAEHLAYCDCCLQCYSDLLAGTDLAAPEHNCRETLCHRIHLRTLGFFTQRYAAAAAGVVLALTLLWGSGHPGLPGEEQAPDEPAIPYTETLQNRWDDAMEQTSAWFSGLLDRIDPL